MRRHSGARAVADRERHGTHASRGVSYLDKPMNDLPPIAAADLRMKGPGWDGPHFIEDPKVPGR